MSPRPSAAERLDHAVDGVLDGLSPGVAAAAAGIDPTGRQLVALAAELRANMATPPVAPALRGASGHQACPHRTAA